MVAFEQAPAFKLELIERLDLRVHSDALNLTGRKLPDSALAAQISIYHWAAAALLRHHAGIAESELPCVQEAVVRALQEAVFPVRDATLASDQAYARLTMKGGRVLEARVEHATGSAARLMTDLQLKEKFRALASGVLDEAKVARLLAVCRHMDAAEDLLEVFHASTP